MLEGRSRSNFKKNEKKNSLIKYDENNKKRLIRQAQKQKQFNSEIFKKPNILSINKNGFEMEYINGKNFINFFEESSVENIKTTFNTILGHFEIDKSRIEVVNEKIDEKLNSLYPNSNYKKLIKKLISFNYRNEIAIPLQECHGDLTFSNMIFRENSIYLIDFLDSFIESKIIDLIKIKQDTQFYWSIEVNGVYSRKVEIILSQLDNILNNKFRSLFQTYEYKILLLINFLRIEPYVYSQNEETRLREILIKLDTIIKI